MYTIEFTSMRGSDRNSKHATTEVAGSPSSPRGSLFCLLYAPRGPMGRRTFINAHPTDDFDSLSTTYRGAPAGRFAIITKLIFRRIDSKGRRHSSEYD